MTASNQNTTTRHKVLLLDDDPDVLALYQEMILQLPSQPEVQVATSGTRAMELLESQPFNLLVSDLKMPRMDGLQVLAIVRKKFPNLKTVVLTGVADEQIRSRAYSMGIDLYLQKPGNAKELTFLLDCIESLLTQEESGGFRGVQSKSLVDLIQLECLSGSSAVLKITNGKLDGKIWIQHGEVIDAATEGLQGEEAFTRIMSWKTGTFENLPADPSRERKIITSYQGLLLTSAQAMDEAQAAGPAIEPPAANGVGSEVAPVSGESVSLGRIHGLEFAIKLPKEPSGKVLTWGIDNTEQMVRWILKTTELLEQLGANLQFGAVEGFTMSSLQRHLKVVNTGGEKVGAGILGSLSRQEVEQTMKKLLEAWAS